MVLKSEARGTGKSTVSLLIEKLLGQHAIRIQDGKHLLGAFNNHLANKLFVTIEEDFWSVSSKDAVEVDSYHRFMMCTNNDWAVPQTRDERRFFVLEVSEEKMQDKDYFSNLYKANNSEQAIGQLFNFLTNYNIDSYSLNKAPKTAEIDQQILESLSSEAECFLTFLKMVFCVQT